MSPWLAAIAVSCGSLAAMSCAGGVARPEQMRRHVRLLQTTDLHTSLFPWDYFSGTVDEKRGLTKVATLVKNARAEAEGCSLLIDTGDTIQGTPLATYYALVDNAPVHPMAQAMNALHYDAMTAGNHEFNYGLAVLDKFARDVQFPILAANVRTATVGSSAAGATSTSDRFTPFIVKDVCGIKVGILGLVTPGVTTWERPENITGLQFDDPIETARVYVPRVRAAGADVVVVAIHAGPDKQPTGKAADPASWLADYDDGSKWADRGNLPGENGAVQIGQRVDGIDVLLTGHTHQPIPKMLVKGPRGRDVLMLQPGRWASHLGVVDLSLVRRDGRWAIESKDSSLRPVDANVVVDADVASLVRGPHETTLAYVNRGIGSTAAAFPGGIAARYVDSALGDLINTVQEEAAAAAGHPVDLSLAAIFSDEGHLPAGSVSLRDAYSIYVYDNTLYVMEIDGSILRRALELNAHYFKQWSSDLRPDASDPESIRDATVQDFNWDLYSRIEYRYDLTRPQGSRVVRLRLRGRDIADRQPLRIAINNYRAGGGGGYAMFKEGKVLWTSADGVRDYVARYIQAHPNLAPNTVNSCNASFTPDPYAYFFKAKIGPAKCSP